MNDRYYEVQLEYEPTCLMNCKHCSSVDIRRSGYGVRGYNDEDLIAFLNAIGTNSHLYLTGGEPLLSSTLIDTAQKISTSTNAFVGFFSCGVTSKAGELYAIDDEYARQLKRSGIVDCYISIYHCEAKIHNYITGKESFNYTIKSIQSLIRNNVKVKIHLVLNLYNIDRIDDIIMYLKGIGVNEVRILRLIRAGAAKDNWDSIGIPYEKQNEEIFRLIKNIYPSINVTISGYPEITACRSFQGAKWCQAGCNLLYIKYNGDVYPCACTKDLPDYRIGHITDIEKIKQFILEQEAYHNHCLNSPFAVL